MERATKDWTLAEIAELLNGTLEGPPDYRITGPATAESGGPSDLAFAENLEFFQKAVSSNVGAIIVFQDAPASEKPIIRVEKPKSSFGKFLAACQNLITLPAGVHPTAVVSEHARISPSARVGAYAVIEAGVEVAEGAQIFPFVFLGTNCRIGRGAILYPHSVLYGEVTIGENSIVHSHAVLGSDGFGYSWDGTEHVKYPHIGKTEIGANVEIGAGTTVDRAMMGVTTIGDGSKLDNQVQVGHNTSIGKHAAIVSQTGIGGSCQIGDRCTLAGQVGLGDHVVLGDDITLTARAATVSAITEPGVYRGAPAHPYSEELRVEASVRKLPQLMKRVKELERKIEELSAIHEA